MKFGHTSNKELWFCSEDRTIALESPMTSFVWLAKEDLKEMLKAIEEQEQGDSHAMQRL